MGKDQVFKLFLEDMDQPAIRLALYSSFRRYAQRRDELINIYTRQTGIPAEEFHSVIARGMATTLG